MSIADKELAISNNNATISAHNVTIAENEQKVYDSGYSKAEYDWWVKFTNNGIRDNYAYAFHRSAFEYLRPPFKIVPTYVNTFSQIFCGCKKLKKIEKDCWDFSKRKVDMTTTSAYNGYYWTFASCDVLEEVEDLGFQPEKYYHSVFKYCRKLHTIEKIRVAEYTNFQDAFYECYALENLTIEGVIGAKNFNVQSSTKLTHDSLMSIINALADYSADTSGTTWTVTLGPENIAKLTEEEKMIAFMKGWDLA